MAFQLGDILARVKLDTSDVKQGVSDVTQMGEKTQSLGDKIQKGMNVAAVGLGVAGAGLTLFAKNATDRTMELVSNAKSLGREIGTSTEEASRLTAALGRMGIDAGSASASFGIFARNIVQSTTQSKDNQLANEKLQIQIDKTKQSIKETTDEIKKNGDKTGDLSLKLRGLKNDLETQQQQLNTSADGFAKLGVKTTDVNGKQKDFSTLLGEVADKFKALPDGIDKTALSMDLFGRQGKDMIKFLNLGSDGIADLEKQADALGLTLNEKTISSIKNLVDANKDLKQQNDALMIAVGTAAAPLQTTFKEALNDVLKTLLDTKGPLRDITVGFLAFGGSIASGLSAFIGFLANVGPAIEIMKNFANALRITAVAQWALNVAMDANPIVLIALAIAGLIAGLVLLYENVDSVRNFIDMAFNWILNIIQTVWHWISDNWPLLLAIITGPFGLAVYEIVKHWDNIKHAAADAWQFIVGIWQGVGDWFRGIGEDIKHALGSAFGFLGGIFSGAWDELKNGFKAALNFIVDQANKFINAYNKTLGKLPSTPYISPIARFARGTEDFAGGGAIVGEEGAELGLFPSGTKIVPHNLTANLVDNLMSVGDMLRAFIGQGSAAFLAGGQANPALAGGQTIDARFIVQGDVNIDSQQDANYLVDRAQNRLDRNAQLASMGISTINPPGAP